MNKFGDLLNGIPLAGMIISGFLAGTLYGSKFDGEEWETLAAGFLGLTGGACALFAAKAQITAQRRQREDDIQREAALANTRYYLLGKEVGELCELFARSTSERLSSQPIEIKELQTMHDALIATEIPKAPLTCSEEITSTYVSLTFLRSRLLIFFTSMTRELETSPEGIGMSVAPDKEENPTGLLSTLDDMMHLGRFLKESCEEQLKR
ncbi:MULTISPECIES: hypothetical protein [Thalassospira]|nr:MULTISPECIES: hypothetical protein [Thalassospira]MBR9901538.1 hypothetical protein [Rhodospirillales bacterium]